MHTHMHTSTHTHTSMHACHKHTHTHILANRGGLQPHLHPHPHQLIMEPVPVHSNIAPPSTFGCTPPHGPVCSGHPRNLFIVQSAARLTNYIHKLTGNALLISSTGYYVAHKRRHSVSNGLNRDQSDFKTNTHHDLRLCETGDATSLQHVSSRSP